MKFTAQARLFTLGLLTLILSQTQAFAQTGPELAKRPWAENQVFELQTSLMAIFQGGTTNSTYNMARNQTTGRVKVPLENDYRMSVGYEHKFYNIGTDEPGVPNQLIDQTMAVSFGLPQFDEWKIDFVVGGGLASNMQYKDDNAYYAKLNLIVGYEIDETSELAFGINYDGNRTFMPDIPLPGIAYSKRVNEKFSFVAGFPFTSFVYKPVEKVKLFGMATPGSFIGGVGYQVLENIEIYADYNEHFDGYNISGDDENNRLFVQIRRAEAGFRGKVCKNFDFTLAGGFAFNQQIRQGWDSRDDSLVARLSDEPFIRVGFTFKF